jgi:diguanylate cyclase (GGDEF)-like protein/PAS domain S-box-containing protein
MWGKRGIRGKMDLLSFKKHELNKKKLPDSVYKSVVSSLYADPISLAIGILCCIAGSLVLYYKTSDPTQLIFASIFFLIGSTRLLLTRAFNQNICLNSSIKSYQNWENKYNITSTSYILLLGTWYASGLMRSVDPYVQLLSLSLILCYLIGIIGRNFASKKVVASQVIASIFMLIGSAIFFDNLYGIVLTLFLLPFLFAIQIMSSRLRGMLFRAEINSINNRTIANRFDVALENITHGIAMIDKNGTVVVANDRFMILAGMKDWEIVGCNISILQNIEVKNHQFTNLGGYIEHCLNENESEKSMFTLNSGVIIEAEYNSTIDGGVIVLSDISERKASEKVIVDLANFDSLTGLYNRRYFIETVESYLKNIRRKSSSSMYFIDLDKFKEINDTLGHVIGDELLKIVGSRLKLLMSEDDVLCRFGGDEFVMFCPNLNTPADCKNFADLILKELKAPLFIKSNHIDISASIGIAISPIQEIDANTLLQHADVALYESKAKGRSTSTFYTADLGEALTKRRELETDLRKAVRNNEIELFYQPFFDIKKCTVVGCEALARWNHPVLGNISPAVFIEMAEEMGLIVPLGEQVLRKAMLECLKWPDHMRVAVNVSSIQFQKTDIYKTVKKLLDETGLPPSKLNIEVTESAMIDSVEDIKVTLNQLSNLGIHISLDDFGTGFSSLSYLHTLPFDKVKIDKSFVENCIASERSLILLKSVVDLIKRLGLKVVLEGIETQEQFRVLGKSIDVHEYQGYLFFKPMSADDFSELVYKTSLNTRENITRLVYSN